MPRRRAARVLETYARRRSDPLSLHDREVHDEERVVHTLLVDLAGRGVHVGMVVETTGHHHADVVVRLDHGAVVGARLGVDHGLGATNGLDHRNADELRETEASVVGQRGVLGELDELPGAAGDGVDRDLFGLTRAHDDGAFVADDEEHVLVDHLADDGGGELHHVGAVADRVELDEIHDVAVGDVRAREPLDREARGEGLRRTATATDGLVVERPLGEPSLHRRSALRGVPTEVHQTADLPERDHGLARDLGAAPREAQTPDDAHVHVGANEDPEGQAHVLRVALGVVILDDIPEELKELTERVLPLRDDPLPALAGGVPHDLADRTDRNRTIRIHFHPLFSRLQRPGLPNEFQLNNYFCAGVKTPIDVLTPEQRKIS